MYDAIVREIKTILCGDTYRVQNASSVLWWALQPPLSCGTDLRVEELRQEIAKADTRFGLTNEATTKLAWRAIAVA